MAINSTENPQGLRETRSSVTDEAEGIPLGTLVPAAVHADQVDLQKHWGVKSPGLFQLIQRHTDTEITELGPILRLNYGSLRERCGEKLSNTFVYHMEHGTNWILRSLPALSFRDSFECLLGTMCYSRHRGENKKWRKHNPYHYGVYIIFLKLYPKEYLSFRCSDIRVVLFSSNGLPKWLSGKESASQCRRPKRCGLSLWVEKILWRRKWQPTPVFLPGESHGQRSLAATVRGCKELGMTEGLSTHYHQMSYKNIAHRA